MKKTFLASAIATALVCAPLAQAAELTSHEQKVSYIMGLDVGSRMAGLEYPLDIEAFRLGLEQSDMTGERALSDDELRNAMQMAQQRFQERQQQAQALVAEKNSQEGDVFLAENAKKSGITTTESGLQYQITSAGTGPKPSAEDTVRVHYRGTLLDGTEFDSSYTHGEPATFPLNGVIPGWTEGLQLISQGSKAKLYIPAELAYGATGMGQAIGPNSTLIFEVELLEINPKQ